MSDILEAKVDNLAETVRLQGESLRLQGESLNRVEEKVFNGFGTKIDNINTNIVHDREINEVAHVEVKKTLGAIIKFGATSFIAIFMVLLSILGSLWLNNGENVPMEVSKNVPIVVPDTTSP